MKVLRVYLIKRRKLLKLIFLLLFTSMNLFAASEYPLAPDPRLTPGSFCNQPDAYRYPENIPYCNRESLIIGVKEDVFNEYRRKGYRLDPRTRSDYKIDHLVPLCAGGSNEADNLWPQHKSLYIHTDTLESTGCDKLKTGRITQAAVVRLIIEAKRNVSTSINTLRYLQSL